MSRRKTPPKENRADRGQRKFAETLARAVEGVANEFSCITADAR